MHKTPTSSRARGAHRCLSILLTAAAGVACAGDATAPLRPADLAGTYAAQTFEGHALPWVDTSATDTTRSQTIWYSLRLTLRADSTALEVDTLGFRDDPRGRPEAAPYRWALNPADVPSALRGTDVVRLRYTITAPHATPYTDFYYRVEGAGRRLVALDAGGSADAVYARE